MIPDIEVRQLRSCQDCVFMHDDGTACCIDGDKFQIRNKHIKGPYYNEYVILDEPEVMCNMNFTKLEIINLINKHNGDPNDI
jgi:hypothetical protein